MKNYLEGRNTIEQTFINKSATLYIYFSPSPLGRNTNIGGKKVGQRFLGCNYVSPPFFPPFLSRIASLALTFPSVSRGSHEYSRLGCKLHPRRTRLSDAVCKHNTVMHRQCPSFRDAALLGIPLRLFHIWHRDVRPDLRRVSIYLPATTFLETPRVRSTWFRVVLERWSRRNRAGNWSRKIRRSQRQFEQEKTEKKVSRIFDDDRNRRKVFQYFIFSILIEFNLTVLYTTEYRVTPLALDTGGRYLEDIWGGGVINVNRGQSDPRWRNQVNPR